MPSLDSVHVFRNRQYMANLGQQTVEWADMQNGTSWTPDPTVGSVDMSADHSPLEIKIALHYWCYPHDYENAEGPHWNSPVVRDIIRRMQDAGLIVTLPVAADRPAIYGRGPALRCYIDALCSIPWPVQVWKIPDGTDG